MEPKRFVSGITYFIGEFKPNEPLQYTIIHTPGLCSLVCQRIDLAGRVEACQVGHVRKKIQHIVVSQIARDQKGFVLTAHIWITFFSLQL